MNIPDMSKLHYCFYLCNNKITYIVYMWFPYDHYIKYGKVTLFDNYDTYKSMVVVKPRNIYFCYTQLSDNKINSLIKLLSTQDWQKHALCDLDLNNYPEIFI